MPFKKKYFLIFFVALFILFISIFLDIKTSLELGLIEVICVCILISQIIFIPVFEDIKCPLCRSWDTHKSIFGIIWCPRCHHKFW